MRIMKTDIEFIDNATGERSNCGEPLEIELSSKDLEWNGIKVEKGWSPHFYPENVVTHDFYFALATESKFSWEAEIEGKMSYLKTFPGDIWINSPNMPFTHKVDEPCYFIIFTIAEEVLYKNFEGAIPDKKLQFLNNYNLKDNNLKNFIELFLFEAKVKNKNGKFFLNSLIKLFSIYFIKNYSNYEDLTSKDKKVSKLQKADFEKITNYILENLENNITIEDIANELNMSKFYFLKEFKKLTDITPYQYLLQLKLERAKELLKQSGNQIADIAYILNFNDQSHFTNTFRKAFGISPGQYKSNK
jgi:AraC family transcriptional regulator